MTSTSVRYLVSNSLSHPENTAANFKVTFKEPFDLTGKRIALVNATLTKAEANVLEEKIVFNFKPQPIKLKGEKVSVNIADFSLLPLLTNWQQFFHRYNKTLSAPDNSPYFEVKSKVVGKKVVFTVTNHTDYNLLIG